MLSGPFLRLLHGNQLEGGAGQIRLVGGYNPRQIGEIGSQFFDLLPEAPDLFERFPVIDGKDEEEGVGRGDREAPHGREFQVTGRVQDVQRDEGPVVDEALAVEVFNGRSVGFDELVVEKALKETSLADSASSQHDQSVPLIFVGHDFQSSNPALGRCLSERIIFCGGVIVMSCCFKSQKHKKNNN